MRESDLTRIIEAHPSRGPLPTPLVKAICFAESNFDEWAYRYEPHYRWIVGDGPSMNPSERIGQMISWGLMQVMGGVAREHGFESRYFTELCNPEVGLSYGMLHLRKFWAKYQHWPDTIASYNAGRPVRGEDGNYLNQSYVDKVLRYWSIYENQVPIKETEV